MANSLVRTVVEDGAKNFIVELVGVVDTSDIAATGTLGTAASGATTTGSPVITFTAGGLAPLLGQYVTGTGIPAGAYIISIDSSTQVTLSANATATGSGLTFTLVAGNIVIADPSKLWPLNVNDPATDFTIKRVQYKVEQGLEVRLFWDATTPVYSGDYVFSGDDKYNPPLPNSAGAGKTGNLLLATQGWTSGAVLSFMLVIALVKH